MWHLLRLGGSEPCACFAMSDESTVELVDIRLRRTKFAVGQACRREALPRRGPVSAVVAIWGALSAPARWAICVTASLLVLVAISCIRPRGTQILTANLAAKYHQPLAVRSIRATLGLWGRSSGSLVGGCRHGRARVSTAPWKPSPARRRAQSRPLAQSDQTRPTADRRRQCALEISSPLSVVDRTTASRAAMSRRKRTFTSTASPIHARGSSQGVSSGFASRSG